MKRTASVARRDEAVATDPVDVTDVSIELHKRANKQSLGGSIEVVARS